MAAQSVIRVVALIVIALSFAACASPIATVPPQAVAKSSPFAASASPAPKINQTLQPIDTPPNPSTPPPTASLTIPRPDYPLAFGNTWVYESTRYEGFNATDIMTATSTITETAVEIQTDPTYFAAKIRQEASPETPIAGLPDLQDLARPASTTEYWLIVTGDRLYRQDKQPDLSNLQSTDALELVFPLKPDTKWVWLPARLPTDVGTDGVYRQIQSIESVQVPAGRFDNCFLIQNGWVTDTSSGWFCPGVGWVEQKTDHNGTPFGGHRVLLRYQLNPPSATAAREALDRFMQARIGRQDRLVLDALTDDLRARTENWPNDVWLYQVSNPCWYRYTVVQFEQTITARAQARVRVYQHDWAGDAAGGLPESWEQVIGLGETRDGWRVDEMTPAENQRQEPSEPHGPTLSACNVQVQSPTPPMEPPTLPVMRYAEFTTLNEAIQAAPFPVLVAAYIPDETPFYKAWLAEYADGSQSVRLVYSPPANDPHANVKSFDIILTNTNKPLTLDSIALQFRETALDVQQVQVRNTTGYAYWTPAASMGNSAVLVWREGALIIRISANGPWPAPGAENPHGLDERLLKIAESLRAIP